MRLRIDLAYDGGNFHGWAKQTNLRTVQGELESALDMVLRTTRSNLTVAGRTDTGVHARHQVAHFDVEPEILDAVVGRSQGPPVESLVRRVNGVVSPDVRVHRISVAPEGFNARFSAIWRRYTYRIADASVAVDPLTRSHVLTWLHPLDEAAMNEAAKHLVGLNDFAAFCRKRPGATTTRQLLDLHWTRNEDGLLEATVRADAFCHNMVRSLIGCMVNVGEGRHEPAWVADVLTRRQRNSAVKVAHAHGLTLEEVAYPADDEVAAQALANRRRREQP
jgi:tRNA pseudouridine38-40 synthase